MARHRSRSIEVEATTYVTVDLRDFETEVLREELRSRNTDNDVVFDLEQWVREELRGLLLAGNSAAALALLDRYLRPATDMMKDYHMAMQGKHPLFVARSARQ